MSDSSPRSRSPGWIRWLNVGLRLGHVAAIIWIGATLLGAPVSGNFAVMAVAATGLAMFGLDIFNKPDYLREVSGLAVLPKLLLIGWMATDPANRAVLFWTVVGGSVIFAHAPARFRHAVLIGPRA